MMDSKNKKSHDALILIAVLGFGFFGGFWLSRALARASVMCGPFSDDYGPALLAVEKARIKIADGDLEVTQELDAIQGHLEHAKAWSARFVGSKDFTADGASSGLVQDQ
jgi:hypothetical protein